MTICYPLTAQLDYTELKYSLRSIEKYLTPPFEVVIVGNVVPEWINHITQIHLPDVHNKKQLSIKRKILAALEYTEEILFLNDDIFFLKPIANFPYYYHGYLKHYPEAGSKQLLKQLETINKPALHFDGHMPIVYKQDFKELNFSDECIIKSQYCNYFEIPGKFTADCKLLKNTKPEDIRNFIADKDCFSTGVYSIASALPILEELFPEPSKFEI